MSFSTRNTERSLVSMRDHNPEKIRCYREELRALATDDLEETIYHLKDNNYEGWRLEVAEECLKARKSTAPTSISLQVNNYTTNPVYLESVPSIIKSTEMRLAEPKNLPLPFTINPGFSKVKFADGREFSFRKRQGKIVEYLVQHTTGPDRHFVPKSKVMEDLGTPASEWKNAFRDNKDARDAVIEEDETQKEVRIRL